MEDVKKVKVSKARQFLSVLGLLKENLGVISILEQ